MVNQDAYQAAMRDAANAAWDRDWEQAIAEYRRALQFAPDDSQAMAGLALSLMEAGHLDEALHAYERVSELVPGDPLPHEKIAAIYEITGKNTDAAKKYAMVAEIYFARKDLERAVPNWQHSIYLDSNLPQPHMRLAVVYERDKETLAHAIYEYVEVARLLQALGQPDKADQSLQRARRLDPLNSDVRNAVDDLKRNNPIQSPQAPSTPAAHQVKGTGALSLEDEFLPPGEGEDVEQRRSPADEAARAAMAVMADMVFGGQVPGQAMGPLMQAMDLHQIGEIEAAIEAYKHALSAGFDHPALRLNLGLLYQHARRPDESIAYLSQVAHDAQYAVAANLAMGLAYFAGDDLNNATRRLVASLYEADKVLNPSQVDEAGYERLLSTLEQQPRDNLTELAKSLARVMDDPNWRTKLHGTLAGYAAQGKVSYVPDLMELLTEGGRPEIAEVMERMEMFLERNMLRLAMEEAHYALEKSPDYLPAHRRIADILMKEGRAQEAASKINLVAETYLIRGNPERAADLFAEVIQLWPADVAARERVIEMLRAQGRVNEVMQQYKEMGDLYYRLRADPDKAITIYNEALSFGARNNADPEARVGILKSLADIESQRLNWREALGYYEKIQALVPNDEETALAVIDMNFQMGQPDRAVRALDEFMRQCVTSGRMDRVVSTLEEQVRRHPDEPALRQRLADVYRQQRRVPEAIAQLDTLGELYLDQGRKADAINTIRKILSLNPPDVEGYQQLLAQLEAS